MEFHISGTSTNILSAELISEIFDVHSFLLKFFFSFFADLTFCLILEVSSLIYDQNHGSGVCQKSTGQFFVEIKY